MSIHLIKASGADREGLLEQLSETLNVPSARLLDVGQSVIHSQALIGMLVELPSPGQSASCLEALRERGQALGLAIQTLEIAPDDYERWVGNHGQERQIITVFGHCLSAAHLERVGQLTTEHGLNIVDIRRLSGRPSLASPCEDSYACVQLTVRGSPVDAVALRREVLKMAQALQCDVAIQRDDMFRRNRRMIAFDMDSTLIQVEVIDELARAHGVVDKVAAITEKAMNGELDFSQSLRQRLQLLKGLDTDVMQTISERLPLTRGARQLIETLKGLGYRTAILSGGFTYFARHLQELLGVDYVFANELEIVDGQLTGEVVGPIVNAERKASLLKEIAGREEIRMEQVIAVGDGANDLPMLSEAGLGIAFHAKPKVRASAEQQISSVGLDGILYMLGMTDRDATQLRKQCDEKTPSSLSLDRSPRA